MIFDTATTHVPLILEPAFMPLILGDGPQIMILEHGPRLYFSLIDEEHPD